MDVQIIEESDLPLRVAAGTGGVILKPNLTIAQKDAIVTQIHDLLLRDDVGVELKDVLRATLPTLIPGG